MIYKLLSFRNLLPILFLGLSFSLSAQATIDEGKTLFKNYCAACHVKNMTTDATGPALAGYAERWADYPQEDLYNWIKNSQAMIADGHPRAVELWNEWKPTVMTAWPNLTDENIESILMYVDNPAPPPPPIDPNADPVEKEDNSWLYYLLFGLLLILALILARIITNLNHIAAVKDGDDSYRKKSLLETFTSKGVISFLIFALVVLGAYTTVNNAINLGRQQGYAPVQPIKFSHETHAGLNGIDCQYCHDGARRSKHAVIPAANTCMNCHEAIKLGSTYGTAEISKIYASIGFNPNGVGSYIENYDEMPEDSIKAIFTQWIGNQYVAAKGLVSLDKDGEKEVEAQWDAIKSSLTNEQKKKIQGPIEWTRVHNLPDHVYFNHAQHVSIGKIECQQCHGTVEEMPVLQQYSPLSMGWCINCHRETEVKFTGNEYYESYETYHNEIKEQQRTGVTVEDIGGLECQKCHY
jgi:cytochrome c2